MTDKAYVVPLHEQLARVPRNARLVIDDADGMGTTFIPVGRYCHEAADALRAALAQPEPEPFEYWNAVEGWVKIDEVRQHFDTAGCGTIYKTGGEGRVPLYAAREWQGLTDKEIENCFEMSMFGTCRAIEAKLKEKNEN